MFSIARFREFTGVYPRKITIVGYQFKRRRFEELHRVALRWSAADLEYVGLSLGGTMEEQEAYEGEPYSADLYGCHQPLSTKRASRNPHGRIHAYHTSAPELRGLLEWCPASRASVFTGALPWDGA
ncbi:hypothetical protein EW146_g2772 [Bondarzewia mesenterica]|uniref:Uncharacterized protein n=1 Tax=Bondarzewia mesenterica TaxID=1095465 RepID=A0A4S4LZL3_9AGAM|nr:hypothetical protein EW146_g2772 [Bondarzewia mesenterica]